MNNTPLSVLRGKLNAIHTILQSDETFASASNLIVPIVTMYELFQQKSYKRHACNTSDTVLKITSTIRTGLENKNYTIVDQQLFDTMAKLYPLYAAKHAAVIIISIFCGILLSSQNLSYDNALQIYNDSITKYWRNATHIAPNLSYIFMKLIQHKTLPLSEQDALNIIRYPEITIIVFDEIKEYLPYTYNVLYKIIVTSRYNERYDNIITSCRQKISEITMSTDEYFFALVDAQDRASHKGLLQEYVSNRTRHNMDGIREFMRTLITYDYPELLHIYMRNNALQYTIDDLESACSETNKNVILEIVNNKILPNEKCVEYVLQQFDECNSYRIYNSMCHIIAIFIHCGYTIPDHVLQRVLQNAQNMLTDDMHAIFKYGFDRPAIDIFIPRY